MTPIADTGLLVGFLDKSDQYHGWAATCFSDLSIALTTCEAVLTETEYLVPGSGPLLMEMIRRGALLVAPILPGEAEKIGALMKKYPRMQFADACVVRLSEMEANAVVYTTDKRDFAIFRRGRTAKITTITP